MKSKSIAALLVAISCLVSEVTFARDWTDATGKHKFSGDLIAASPETILLRGKRKTLEAYVVSELSEADQAFVKEYLESKTDDVAPEKMQTWTGREGVSLRGRVIGYGTRALVITTQSGAIQVNKTPLSRMDQIYKKMMPKIVAEFDDKSVKTESDLALWGRKLRGKERSFTVDGVLMELENGEKIAVPLFLFSEKEREVLEAGWDTWKAETTAEEERNRESFLAEASAAEYHRSQEAAAQASQQIQLMQLGMMAVNAGIAEIWQVQMMPRPGVRARPMVVMVPAQNSAQAQALAAEKYPAFVPGATAQVSD